MHGAVMVTKLLSILRWIALEDDGVARLDLSTKATVISNIHNRKVINTSSQENQKERIRKGGKQELCDIVIVVI
jgi:hypothetical protein